MPAASTRARTIGEVASSTGLSIKTIRFYCDKGLINPVGWSEGGYRLFDATSELELKLIRSLRGLDMPIDEVKAFMDARRSGVCSCQRLQARMRTKKEEIGKAVQELLLLQDAITNTLVNWQECGGVKSE